MSMTNASEASAGARRTDLRKRTPAEAVAIITTLMANGRARTVLGVGNSDSVSLSWSRAGEQKAPPSALPGARLAVLVLFDVPEGVKIPNDLISFDALEDANAPPLPRLAREATVAS